MRVKNKRIKNQSKVSSAPINSKVQNHQKKKSKSFHLPMQKLSSSLLKNPYSFLWKKNQTNFLAIQQPPTMQSLR